MASNGGVNFDVSCNTAIDTDTLTIMSVCVTLPPYVLLAGDGGTTVLFVVKGLSVSGNAAPALGCDVGGVGLRALQISSAGNITINGVVSARGRGGAGATSSGSSGGGGGSGGALLLEGSAVALNTGARLTANGGGGGETGGLINTGLNGSDGSETSALPAPGGNGAGVNSGNAAQAALHWPRR